MDFNIRYIENDDVPRGMRKKEKRGGMESCVPIKLTKVDREEESVLKVQSMQQQQEERELFGSPSVSSDDDDQQQNNEEQGDDDIDSSSSSEMEEGEDDDGGLNFSTSLMNLDVLHATIERDWINLDIVHDYFHDDCVTGTPLEHECLLVAMYVYYLKSTQKEQSQQGNVSNALVKWYN